MPASFPSLRSLLPVAVMICGILFSCNKDNTITRPDNGGADAISIPHTGLPVVIINTHGKTVADRLNWMDGLDMTILYPDSSADYSGTLSIRGRGNASWYETDKKSYALRLDGKESVLGMPPHKRWILLANYKDYTLLRNDAAFWLSRNTDMPYTIRGQHVELIWNGEHMGNYYLCEQAKIDANRVDTRKPDLEDPSNGGLMVEIDAFMNFFPPDQKKQELGFHSQRFNLPYIFKNPDEKEIDSTSATFRYFRALVDSLESILLDSTRVRNHEYERYLNVNTAIDFALIQEITLNHDAYNTYPEDGPHSTFLYTDSTGLLCFGPVWDFDLYTFMPNLYENHMEMTEQWTVLNTRAKSPESRYYFEYLLIDPKFKESLVEHWDRYKVKWRELPDYIDMMADSISDSEKLNRALWYLKTRNNQNGDRGSFENAIKKMKRGFNKRWEWMDRNIRDL